MRPTVVSRLWRQVVKAQRSVKEWDREPRSIRVRSEIARVVRQFECEPIFALIQRPDPDRPAIAATHGDHKPVRVNRHAPRGPLERLFRTQEMFPLAGRHVEYDD